MGCVENRKESPEEEAMIKCEKRLGYKTQKTQSYVKRFESLASQDGSINQSQLQQALQELQLQLPQSPLDQKVQSQEDSVSSFYQNLQKSDKTFDCFDLQILSIILGGITLSEKCNLLVQLLSGKGKEDPKYISKIQITRFVITALKIVIEAIPEMIVGEYISQINLTLSNETKNNLQYRWNKIQAELSQQIIDQIMSSPSSTHVHIDHFLNVLIIKNPSILSSKGIRQILRNEEFKRQKKEVGL